METNQIDGFGSKRQKFAPRTDFQENHLVSRATIDLTSILPSDIWILICRQLDVVSLLSFGSTCLRWYRSCLNLVDTLELDPFVLGLRSRHFESLLSGVPNHQRLPRLVSDPRSQIKSISLGFVAMHDNSFNINADAIQQLTILQSLSSLVCKENADPLHIWGEVSCPSSPWTALFTILPSMTQLQHVDLSWRMNVGDIPSMLAVSPEAQQALLHGLPKLRSLGLSRVDITGWKFWQATNPIEYLKLSRCDIGRDTFSMRGGEETEAQTAAEKPLLGRLKFLTLDRCAIAPDSLSFLPQVVNLEGFTMVGVGLPSEALRNAHYAPNLIELGLCRNLKFLKLKSTLPFGPAFAELVANLSSLESFELSDVIIESHLFDDDDDDEGSEGNINEDHNGIVEHEEDEQADGPKPNGFFGPFMQGLKKASLSLSVAGWFVKHLNAFQFENLESLTTVWIDDWPLEGLLHLAPNLRKLSLDWTLHFEEIDEAYEEMLTSFFTGFKRLESLDLKVFGLLSNQQRLLTAISKLSQLEELKLHVDTASQELDFTPILSSLTQLRRLSLLSGCPIMTASHISSLALLADTLEHLELRNIDPSSCLCHVVPRLKNLVSLSLGAHSDSGLSITASDFRKMFFPLESLRVLKLDFKVLRPGLEVLAWRIPQLLQFSWGQVTRYRPVLSDPFN